MAGEVGEARAYSTQQTWFGGVNNNTAPAETEKEKLHKGNVWDYANAMQAGAYMS